MFRPLLFLLALTLTAAGLSAAGAPKRGISIFDRWEQRTNHLRITLRADFDSLEASRYTLDELRGTVVEGSREYGVDISVRGRFRRRTCTMPPLKLQFDKDMLRAVGLNTHNDYKLVTHCTSDRAGQEALIREQLAYELYHLIAPEASFRTQLLTVTYHNVADGSETTSYAILIEDTDELKDRLDTQNCKDCYNLPAERYANAEMLALFQYMIGNADYSTRLLRNLKLMEDAEGRITAVPYDFDFSGLVSPSYLNEQVKVRELVWEFTATPEFDRAAATLLNLEDTLMDHIAQYEALDSRPKREVAKYVKQFFKKLERGRIQAK